MYKNFFGLNERPFKLVPNPAYLFLSKNHEEALAHLTYAVIQGEGFMEITGEVGTGKTTLCRAFLDHLDLDTKAAYIFNPNLDSLELLKAINDEFDIPSDANNLKDLIDTLNTFLIEQKARGKNTILLIDEAQNLTNEVLEQLRLLSNLETAKHKLLHIILVGQPELREKLDSYELRQLRQRISLSCRLIPLNFKDVRNYIQHRINIASGNSGIQFDDAAYRSIYNYSKGIPRLVNIVCDRALLTAFSLDQKEITQEIVRASIKELTDKSDANKNRFKKRKIAFLLFTILSMIIFMAIYFHSGLSGLFRMNTNFIPAETKNLNTRHSNNKKPVMASSVSDTKESVPAASGTVKKEKDSELTVFESKKVVPSATASEAKKSVVAATDTDKKEPTPAVAASQSNKAVASGTETLPKKTVAAVTTAVKKEPIPTVAGSQSNKAVSTVTAPDPGKSMLREAKIHEPVKEPDMKPVQNLGTLLKTMNRISSRHAAIQLALNLWNLEPDIKPVMEDITDDEEFFSRVSKKSNLLIRRITGNLDAIKKLNLPVILAVHSNKNGPPVYFVLIRIDRRKVTLRGGKQDVSIELSPEELKSHWSGEAYIPWKNFLSLTGTIPIDSPKESITALKILLRDIGFKEIEISPFYDEKTRRAVKKIQKKYGLQIDGTVGSITKIALYNERKVFKQPRIVNITNPYVR